MTSKGGRPKLTIGTWGSVAVQEIAPTRYRARARYRDTDGATRTVARFGQTKKAAREALHRELQERSHGALILDRHASVELLLDRWLDEIAASERAVQTKDQYRYFVNVYIKPRMKQWSIGEASTGRVDDALQKIAAEHGPSVARSVRSVLRGVFSLAVRVGALTVNPVRETRPIPSGRRVARALTVAEAEDLTDRLRADQRAIDLDLPDLVDFALDTGCRIGELLAIRESDCDLEAGTVTIRGTVVRQRGETLAIQERTKSAAGERVLALPPQAVDLLRRRRGELRFRSPEGVVFPSVLSRKLRDPSNCAGDLREVVERLGCPGCGGTGWHSASPPPGVERCEGVPPYAWITYHVFRKSVATRLDEAGLSARVIADQLGHAQPSMTQNVYLGRRVVSPEAASALAR